ncbi:MAG: hypothetical protein AAFQ94_03060 [Bacteroidota bacterium]
MKVSLFLVGLLLSIVFLPACSEDEGFSPNQIKKLKRLEYVGGTAYDYTYEDNLLKRIDSERIGIRGQQLFFYDTERRIIRYENILFGDTTVYHFSYPEDNQVVTISSSREQAGFYYKTIQKIENNRITKVESYHCDNADKCERFSTDDLEYDESGNLVREVNQNFDFEPSVTTYQYDNQFSMNLFLYSSIQPQMLWAHFSPNNITAVDNGVTRRSFDYVYDSDGYPIESSLISSNGATYPHQIIEYLEE